MTLSVEVNTVNLEKCPYDRSPVEVHAIAASLVVSCDTCGAAWQLDGSSIHRLRAPDADIVRRVRNGLFSPEAVGAEVLPKSEIVDDVVV